MFIETTKPSDKEIDFVQQPFKPRQLAKKHKLLLALHLMIWLFLFMLDEQLFPVFVGAFEWLDENMNFPWTFFRQMGSLPSTILFFLLIWTLAPKKRRWVSLLLIAIIIPNLVTYGLKKTTGRERPKHSDGKTNFEFLNDEFESLPSGHATMAMSNATAFTILVPQAAPVWFTLGSLGGLSRVNEKAHFPSDVYMGFIIGYFGVQWVVLLMRRKLVYFEEMP